jgi:hypothetical protein
MPTEKRHGLEISILDLEKRYDIYQCAHREERLYENVKLIGLRNWQKSTQYESVFGCFLEIETLYGLKMLISTVGTNLICEHGTKPMFKVFRSWIQDT